MKRLLTKSNWMFSGSTSGLATEVILWYSLHDGKIYNHHNLKEFLQLQSGEHIQYGLCLQTQPCSPETVRSGAKRTDTCPHNDPLLPISRVASHMPELYHNLDLKCT